MKRRDFIAVLGGTVGWSLVARAQKSAMPVIGFLSSASPAQWTRNVVAFRQGLNEAGYAEGKNVAIEYRCAEGHYDRLPALAADLVSGHVAVLVATGGPDSALAAKEATSTIPIVFTTGGDPVQLGVVASLGHPGGNATGVYILTGDLNAKRLGLLHEMVPRAATIATLINPTNAGAQAIENEVRAAAAAAGVQPFVVRAGTERDIDAAFAILIEKRIGRCAHRQQRSVFQRPARAIRGDGGTPRRACNL